MGISKISSSNDSYFTENSKKALEQKTKVDLENNVNDQMKKVHKIYKDSVQKESKESKEYSNINKFIKIVENTSTVSFRA